MTEAAIGLARQEGYCNIRTKPTVLMGMDCILVLADRIELHPTGEVEAWFDYGMVAYSGYMGVDLHEFDGEFPEFNSVARRFEAWVEDQYAR